MIERNLMKLVQIWQISHSGKLFFLQGFGKNCYPVIGIRKQEFSMPGA